MVSDTGSFQSALEFPPGSPSSFVRLLRWLLDHIWFVYSSSRIHTILSPEQTYSVLETASSPSVKQLGLRKLYGRGRRYYMRSGSNDDFQMITTSKVWWHPRRRTSATAVVSVRFVPVADSVHRMDLNSRVKIRFLLGQFFWPLFISSIIIFLDWSPLIVAISIIGLFAFSWFSFRLTAMLEAHEIAFFIETVLNNFAPGEPERLTAPKVDIIVDDFTVEWDRYVDEQRKK